MTYDFVYEENTLKIIVDALDIQQPEIINKEGNNTLSLKSSTMACELPRYFEIKDNDQIASIQIMHNETVYNWLDNVIEGGHTLTVIDRTGNKTDYEFMVLIV